MIDVKVGADVERALAGDPQAFADVAGLTGQDGSRLVLYPWQVALIVTVLRSLGLIARDVAAGLLRAAGFEPGEGAPRMIGVLASRQVGKSITLALLAAMVLVLKPGARVLIVSAGEDAARRLFADLRGVLAAPALRSSIVEEASTSLRLSTGSSARSVPASEKQIRGDRLHLLIGDELAYGRDGVIESAGVPSLAATGGVMVFASSAGPAYGTLFNLVMAARRGAGHVRLFEATLADAPHITATTEAMLRAGMSPFRAASELDNQFASQGSLVFVPGFVESLFYDVETSGIAGLGLPLRVYAGLDVGGARSGGDPSVLAVLARLAGTRTVVVPEVYSWPVPYPLTAPDRSVVADVCSSPLALARLTIDRTGLGEAVAEQLGLRLGERPADLGGGVEAVREPALWATIDLDAPSRVGGTVVVPAPDRESRRRARGFSTAYRPVSTTAEMKVAMTSAIRALGERGALVIPTRLETLRRQLTLLSVEMLPSGTERVAAPAGGHDDEALALMYAMQPYRDQRGRWRSYVAGLVDPSAAIPEPAGVVSPAGDVLTGPGGLELHRYPALQSFTDGGVLNPNTTRR